MENKQFPDPQEEPVFDELVFDSEEPVINTLDFQPLEEKEDPLASQTEVSAMPEPDLPDTAIPAEQDLPVIEAMEMAPEEPVPDDVIQEEAVFEGSFPEAPVPEESGSEAPAFAESEASQTSQVPPQEDTRSFMEKIPDVDEDYPPEEDYSDLVVIDEEEPQDIPTVESEPEVQNSADQEYQDNSSDFDEIFETPKEKPPAPAKVHPPRKGRPKRKKGEGLLGIPNILVTIVWMALILAIGVTSGRMLWLCAADVLAFGKEDKVVTVSIYESDDMESIIDKLHDNGLIRYKGLFRFYADLSDAQEDIKPGIYDLNTRYDYHALVNFMSPKSNRQTIELTIPEGYTCRQIFALLEENRVCTALDAANYAATGELDDYWFLEGVERGSENCLEGYLFPDTYEFYKNSTPREALQRMLNNFNNRFDEGMRAQIDTLNANVTGGGYTVREVTIVASLIERESAAPGESPMVAGVIYNRLFRWGDNPPYLNIDASIVYAQEGQAERIDTSLDSPYNTYTHTGLTPGPIANPGLSSLKAALNPEAHEYYYYVLNPSTGMHQFSKTLDEHNRWVNEFNGG